MRRSSAPHCPLCRGVLIFKVWKITTQDGAGAVLKDWYCEHCGFRYHVRHGRVGPPIWGLPPGVTEKGAPEAPVQDEGALWVAFKQHMEESGWTQEMFDGLPDPERMRLFTRWRGKLQGIEQQPEQPAGMTKCPKCGTEYEKKWYTACPTCAMQGKPAAAP